MTTCLKNIYEICYFYFSHLVSYNVNNIELLRKWISWGAVIYLKLLCLYKWTELLYVGFYIWKKKQNKWQILGWIKSFQIF